MTPRPNNDNSIEREPTPLERAALTWVGRCDRGLTEEQRYALADWLGADPRHRELFNEFGGMWRLLELVAPNQRWSWPTFEKSGEASPRRQLRAVGGGPKFFPI